MWIYLICSTDSIYSQELGESPLHSENTCDQLPTAKSIPIVKQCSLAEWHIMIYRPPLFGMTLAVLTPKECKGELISFAEASPARISALQGAEKAWKESEADYFSRSCAWPKKSSHHSYSLKTSQQFALEGDFALLEKLPKWGMIVDGVAYPLRPLERYTNANDGSYWATPNTMDYMDLRSDEALKRQFTTTRKGRTKPANLREQVHPQCWPQNLFPTPCAMEGQRTYAQHMAMKAKMGRNTCSSLTAYVEKFPTPQACDATKDPAKEFIPNGKQASMRNLVTLAARHPNSGHSNQESIGKKLCPQFVELLMGYPTSWTELGDWVIPWFRSKSKKRSKS